MDDWDGCEEHRYDLSAIDEEADVKIENPNIGTAIIRKVEDYGWLLVFDDFEDIDDERVYRFATRAEALESAKEVFREVANKEAYAWASKYFSSPPEPTLQDILNKQLVILKKIAEKLGV